jgi:hypothetical protein
MVMSYFTYLDLPSVPGDIEQKILDIVERPIRNFHSSDEFVQYTIENRNNLNIEASQEIIDAIKNVDYNPKDSLGFHLSEVWEHFKDLAEFDFLEVSEEINEWARSNINLNIAHVSVQSMYGGKTITPHIDEMRSFAYNYVIERGGDTSTCFWKPKPEYSHLKAYAQTVFPYNRLDLIEEIKIEKGRWHRLDTRQIHSVENLDPSKKRISLSLSVL